MTEHQTRWLLLHVARTDVQNELPLLSGPGAGMPSTAPGLVSWLEQVFGGSAWDGRCGYSGSHRGPGPWAGTCMYLPARWNCAKKTLFETLKSHRVRVNSKANIFILREDFS